MTKERLDLGRCGEELASVALERAGYRKICANYRCRLGEIDLIATEGGVLVFIEIKTRKGCPSAAAKEAVNHRKQRQITKAALNYMKTNGCLDKKARFDVVAIGLGEDGPDIEIIRNAFDAAY
ncbi:MAG: YraN family protein [Deltaproteobacteria bacterium CG_4_8_14_3_um_filter_51_11]|nr:YraN family protein [bacterium]OIP43194.1 MAG: YraN family protein [Desulfobacteraceae bacterium CG2_30_51_40]PIX21110.1 MAG: YraN family protein [Deltaproteobacteria bacterium CG_4_8_14_3_um_filter_51_11]PIY26157.1 MAG: YraN family protein [Deltaproteobacteria bacterium CG_4_10_14_3_um_filter_51_14]PJB37123.1 MAG: YraN family protein [Deltaproteobacteria bacterium CG_4_9_14_3_um_filter_51_14]